MLMLPTLFYKSVKISLFFIITNINLHKSLLCTLQCVLIKKTVKIWFLTIFVCFLNNYSVSNRLPRCIKCNLCLKKSDFLSHSKPGVTWNKLFYRIFTSI